MCHPVLDGHKSTRCRERCHKTPCPLRHPCGRECTEDCGDCLFPIYNITLPCGHVAEEIPCYLLDNLGDVKCKTLVEKAFPYCEHMAIIQCYQDPSSITCEAVCGEKLQCCSKTCKSSCGDCLKEKVGLYVMDKGVRIERTAHKRHPCERDLYCKHHCGLACHPQEESSCNSYCRKPCRQACDHQKCDKPCAAPCTPCMEPCGWRCVHEECPVTCGSICVRLPCDVPCQKTLSCGHPCPSVCGEDCDIQTCLQCLPLENKQDICDPIMQRRLRDLNLNSDAISERIITLECRHIFTVESLDRHCDMSLYYETDPMGRFLSTKIPPADFQTPPVCPTCRGPISALRYGRVTKRATLDILEQNVANTMSRSLQALIKPFKAVSSLIDDKKEKAAEIQSGPSNVKPASRKRAEKLQKARGALSYKALTRAAMYSVHGLSTVEAQAWERVVRDLIELYRQTEVVACTHGSHVAAYEGSLTTLYRLELDAIANEPSRNSETPQPLAFMRALEKIGQIRPKANIRYQIEAYFLLLELRFTLAEIGLSRIEGLNSDEEQETHRRLWISFVDFIYTSCIADSKKALIMAQESLALRQAARCSAYIVRSEFERFKFETLIELSTLALSDTEDRKAILDNIDDKESELRASVKERRQNYIRSRPTRNSKILQEEYEWFDENCAQIVDWFIDDLMELKEFARRGGIHHHVSLQEQEDVIKALGFATTGNFCKCPNGHPFVINECGGATETALCPECGVIVGGSGHQLLEFNSRDIEFKRMLRGQGAKVPVSDT